MCSSARDQQRAMAQQARAANTATPKQKPLFAAPFRRPNQDDKSMGIKAMLDDVCGEYDANSVDDWNRFVGIGDVPGTPQPKNAPATARPVAEDAGAAAASSSSSSASQPTAPFWGDSPPRRSGIKSLPTTSSVVGSGGGGGSEGGNGTGGSGSGERYNRTGGSEVRNTGGVGTSASQDDSSTSRRDQKRKDEKYQKRNSSASSNGSYDRPGLNKWDWPKQ